MRRLYHASSNAGWSSPVE